MEKYELTSETKQWKQITLYRIKALKDFGDIKKGNLGGWVESEENLSHSGGCWIYDNAVVCGNATVCGNVYVYGSATIRGDACICDNARVYNDARVCGNVRVFGNAMVGGNAMVYGNAKVFGNAMVGDNANITNTSDILTIPNIGSRNDTTTFYKNINNGINVTCGCFTGTIEEFEEKVINTHGDSFYGEQYMMAIKMAKVNILEK